jgi:hypothetical protein
VERELARSLLNPEQVNVAVGTAGMAVTHRQTSMSDNSAAAEGPIYADSGYWAERDQSLSNRDHFMHYLKQAVVLLSTSIRAAPTRLTLP